MELIVNTCNVPPARLLGQPKPCHLPPCSPGQRAVVSRGRIAACPSVVMGRVGHESIWGLKTLFDLSG